MDPHTPPLEPVFDHVVRLIHNKFHTIVQFPPLGFVAQIRQSRFVVRSTTTANEDQCGRWTIGMVAPERFQGLELQHMVFFGTELSNRHHRQLAGRDQIQVGQIGHIAGWEEDL